MSRTASKNRNTKQSRSLNLWTAGLQVQKHIKAAVSYTLHDPEDRLEAMEIITQTAQMVRVIE